ncbi:MAG: hypothetical protein ABSH20_30665, partial [Tepidisphaeraceae bacterium]
EPAATDRSGGACGLYLGKLYQALSAAATRAATRPANAAVPVIWHKLPGLELPATLKHGPSTRPASATRPRAPGSN